MTKATASGVADIFKEFVGKSSSPSSARCVTEKIFWICIGTVATSGAAYHLYTIICTYMEHNYYTSITNDVYQPLQVGI